MGTRKVEWKRAAAATAFLIGAAGLASAIVVTLQGRSASASLVITSATLLVVVLMLTPLTELMGRVTSASVKGGGVEATLIAAGVAVASAPPDSPRGREARNHLVRAVASALLPGFDATYHAEFAPHHGGNGFDIRVPVRWETRPGRSIDGPWSLVGFVSGPDEFQDEIAIDLPLVFDDGAFNALLETDRPGAYVIEWALTSGDERVPLRTDEITITGRERNGERIRRSGRSKFAH